MLQDLKEGDEYESASDHESASEKDTNSMNKFDQNSFKIRKATKKQAMFSKPQIPKKVQLFDPNRVLPLDYIPSNNTTIAVTAKKIAPIFTKTLKLNQSSSSSAIIDLTGNVIDAVVNTPCGPSTPQQPGATQNSVEVIELSPPSSQASSIPDSQSPSPQRTMRKLPHLNNPKASGIEKKTASSLYIPSYKK